MGHFNPEIHHRKSIRLPTFNYASAGAYFVTICVLEREYLFGEIKDGRTELNECGRIVQSVWDELPKRYPNIETDQFVVMPNHVHGIIWIVDSVGASLAGAPPAGPGTPADRSACRPINDPANGPLFGRLARAGTRPAPTVGDVIGGFKSITTVGYIRYQKSLNLNAVIPKLWQRDYHDHIIRSESELHAIRQYIQDNPLKWEDDPDHQSDRP